jgi:hypothetical protein
VDTTHELASALKVGTAAFIAMVMASEQRRTPRDILQSAIDELDRFGIVDDQMREQPSRLEPPRVTSAKEKKGQVQELKLQRFTCAQVERELDPTTTVRRLWPSGDISGANPTTSSDLD